MTALESGYFAKELAGQVTKVHLELNFVRKSQFGEIREPIQRF
jgi:hypothetical protein